MFPRSTKYRLATSPSDYKACRALFADNHGADPIHSLSFPTVMAERDGTLMGFFSTYREKKALIAGPVEIRGGRNGFLFLRLIEAYDNIMKVAGVSRYIFYVKIGRGDSFDPERLTETWGIGSRFLRFGDGYASFVKEL